MSQSTQILVELVLCPLKLAGGALGAVRKNPTFINHIEYSSHTYSKQNNHC